MYTYIHITPSYLHNHLLHLLTHYDIYNYTYIYTYLYTYILYIHTYTCICIITYIYTT